MLNLKNMQLVYLAKVKSSQGFVDYVNCDMQHFHLPNKVKNQTVYITFVTAGKDIDDTFAVGVSLKHKKLKMTIQ